MSIVLASVDGTPVAGAISTTIETFPHAKDCTQGASTLTCVGKIQASPGDDTFNVTTFAWPNATGAILSAGTVRAHIGSATGNVAVGRLSLSLSGVVAGLRLHVTPGSTKLGVPSEAAVLLQAYDASGAVIVGPSSFQSPVALSISGDAARAFELQSGRRHGVSLTIGKPTTDIRLRYDGSRKASSIVLQAEVAQDASAQARFTLRGAPPPPKPGVLYVLNAGTNGGLGATVTEYASSATGNASPVATLGLSKTLYARSIAVDEKGNLYVGYLDSPLGVNPSSGVPDAKNTIAIYAAGADGGAQPYAYLSADPKSGSFLLPIFFAFDPSGDLVTFGATRVDGNSGDAVLIYRAGASGSAAPAHAWNFSSPFIHFPEGSGLGPTGLSVDASGNFYVNGALKTELSPQYGVYVATASDAGNPSASPARVIPWNTTTGLLPQQVSNIALDASGEVYVANFSYQSSGSSTCQGMASVFAAGAGGGTTSVAPLRTMTLQSVSAPASECISSAYALSSYFPTIAVFGDSLFVADDFNDAISAFPATAQGSVAPSQRIEGSSTGLNAPVAIYVAPTHTKAQRRKGH